MSESAHERGMTGIGAKEEKAYKPFFTEQTPRRYAPDRVVDVQHICLELSFELEKKKLNGIAKISFAPIDAGVREIVLDACDMDLGNVTLDGKPVAIQYDGAKLRVRFSEPPPADKVATIAIPYSVTKPKAGIYFVAPDANYPKKPVEVWTQGQDEDARYWFPCFDYPNEKATSEIVVTVPKNFNTLSNGKLLEVKETPEGKVFHWRHDVPHVAYLVTLVVGEFVEVKDEWDGIPVTYYHHPGDEGRAANSFARTPEMVKFFSEKIGVRYPYAKYSQIPVTDFIFGGMENTTATTQTAFTLHDNRAHLDFTSNPLVSHELAHQWFGNLLTCRDWSHGWLNEGFTTYMECCWEQHEHGDEHFRYYMLQEMERYLDEDKSSYRRPIVCNRYDEPIELFDRHLYEKGGCVQHMIRFLLGEKLFWKAIQHYTKQNAGRCVVTPDWQRAIEETTGKNLDEFFEQWVFGGGHPDFKLGFSHDAAKKLAVLTVTQTQKADDLTAIFKLPVAVAFTKLKEDGAIERREEQLVHVEKGEHRFNIPLDFEPDFVTFDVGNWITKTLDVSGLPETMLIQQLQHDSDKIGRVHAARELGKKASRRAVEALGKALAADAPWFVHAEIAQAIGNVGNTAALEILLAHVSIAHPKARRAVVKALGEFRNETRAADALLAILSKGDPSYFVEAEAAASLGKTRDSRARTAIEQALAGKDSFNEVIRISAIDGLVALDDPAGLAKIREFAKPGVPVRLRAAALTKLGTLGKLAEERERRAIRKDLEEVLEESDFFVSLGVIAGLKELGDPEAGAALKRKERIAVDGRIKARARKAAADLAQKAAGPKQLKDLRDQLDEVRKQNKQFEERLGKLEALQEKT